MNESTLDFSTVIASTVHDMKNSLALLTQSHSQWLARLPAELREGSELGMIEHEFAHLNGTLVQLLGLYKLGVNQLPVCPNYHEMDDFIDAQVAAHRELLDSRGIGVEVSVDPLIPLGFFDRELISSVVANVIINGSRYAKGALRIAVCEDNAQLMISIEDDGPGYPAVMLERQSDYVKGIEQGSGSTGLGLYFAARIAALHGRNGEPGRIQIANGGALGGGVFRLYLP